MTDVAVQSRVGELLSSLTPADKLVALARTLHREGYDDHTTGHITYRQPDGTFLVNPFELTWDELRSSDVMTMDADGRQLAGRHTVTPAITLHVELHRARPDLHVALHGHPRWATAWACTRRVPPVYDQTSALGGLEVAVYGEYGGSVDAVENARGAVAALGDASSALLSNHGVLIVAPTIEMAYMRASTIEWRACRAWQVEMLGGGVPLDDRVVESLARYVEKHLDRFPTFEAAIRNEMRRDPEMFT